MLQHRWTVRIGECEIAKPDLAGRRPRGRARARRQILQTHGRLETEHRRDRRGRAVDGEVESAEGDHRCADRRLGEHDDLGEREHARRGVAGERPEHDDVSCNHKQQAPQDRPLAQTRGGVLELVQPCSSGDEPGDGPVRQAEHTELLAGRWVDGQTIGIVGVALGAADLVGVPVPPHRAFPQEPVRRAPSAREHDRRPPGVRREHDGGGQPSD